MGTTEKAKEIYDKMFHKRLNPNKDYAAEGWRTERPARGTTEQYIKALLDKGYKVTAGWFATSIRGYHDYVVLYKETP